MKETLVPRRHAINATKAAERMDRKKVYALAFATFMMLIIVGEGLRLAVQSL